MKALVCEECYQVELGPTQAIAGEPCPMCGTPLRAYERRERIDLDIEGDVREILAPKPDERRFHEQVWGEADLRLVGRALRGDPPVDDDELRARRTVLNGIVYTLSGEQEVADE